MSTQNTQVPLTPDILKKLEYHHCQKVIGALGGFTDVNLEIRKSFRTYLVNRMQLYRLILQFMHMRFDIIELQKALEKFKSYHDGFFSNSGSTSLSNFLVDAEICGVEPQYRTVWYKDIDELMEFVHNKFAEERLSFISFNPLEGRPERDAQLIEYKKIVIQLAAPMYGLDINLINLDTLNPHVVYNALRQFIESISSAAARSV